MEQNNLKNEVWLWKSLVPLNKTKYFEISRALDCTSGPLPIAGLNIQKYKLFY